MPRLVPHPANWFTARLTTRLLGGTWGGLLLLRLLLLGRGALAEYDERRYFQSFAALRAARHGDWPGCCYALSMTAARPVDALWRCLTAAVQLLLARYAGWELYAYPSLLLPTALNWAATILAAWFFWRICRLLLVDAPAGPQWALVAAVLYASLANTSLYVRHVLPYDGALALFLGLLLAVLRQQGEVRTWFWAKLGLGAGLLWLFYPGYYAGPVLLVAPLLDWRQPVAWGWQRWRQLLALGLGFAGPLLAAEGLSRLGHSPPFWAISYDLSLHVLQGSPAEGYTFLVSYLWHVERALGVVLLVGLALALGLFLRRLSRVGLVAAVPRTPRQKVLAAALLLFLAHATAAAGWHHIVWYGRLLHLYLPFVVLAGVAALAGCSHPAARPGWAARAGLVACLVAVASYVAFWRSYQPLVYPPDLILAYCLHCLPDSQLRAYNEVPVDIRMPVPVRMLHPGPPTNCPPAPADSITVLVNFATLYPLLPATHMPVPTFGPAARVLVDAPYYDTFRAYQYEGLSPAERAEAQRRQFRLRLLRVRAAAVPGGVEDGD